MRFRNIPHPLTPLIGHEHELQAARDLLMYPEVRLVTLTGTGGIGKTHLAMALGNDLLESFAHGVCFVSLESITDSALVIPTIAHALGLQEGGDSRPLDRLKTLLRDMQLLLVLDNFERLLPAAPLLSDVLSACPGLKMLVTSRALMRVRGEYECNPFPFFGRSKRIDIYMKTIRTYRLTKLSPTHFRRLKEARAAKRPTCGISVWIDTKKRAWLMHGGRGARNWSRRRRIASPSTPRWCKDSSMPSSRNRNDLYASPGAPRDAHEVSLASDPLLHGQVARPGCSPREGARGVTHGQGPPVPHPAASAS